MAPATHAVTKRFRGDIAEVGASYTTGTTHPKKARKSIKANDPVPTGETVSDRCYFLELPPGIGNRIYHFTGNDFNCRMYPPLLYPSKPATPQVDSYRSFLSLARTCKQLRPEYRPRWLRAWKPRIHIRDLSQFFKTFYPKTADLHHAPRLLQLSWDIETEKCSSRLYDITPLLQLNVFSSMFELGLFLHKVAEGILPQEEVCMHCELEEHGALNLDGYEDDELDSINLPANHECVCSEDEYDYEDWEINMSGDAES